MVSTIVVVGLLVAAILHFKDKYKYVSEQDYTNVHRKGVQFTPKISPEDYKKQKQYTSDQVNALKQSQQFKEKYPELQQRHRQKNRAEHHLNHSHLTNLNDVTGVGKLGPLGTSFVKQSGGDLSRSKIEVGSFGAHSRKSKGDFDAQSMHSRQGPQSRLFAQSLEDDQFSLADSVGVYGN